MPPTPEEAKLEKAKQLARVYGLDVERFEQLFKNIEEQEQICFTIKYKTAVYLAVTGLYSAQDIAEMLTHTVQNMNSDFNKNIGKYLKPYFILEDSDRVGITCLRRIVFNNGYFTNPSNDNTIFSEHLPDNLKSKSSEEDDQQNV